MTPQPTTVQTATTPAAVRWTRPAADLRLADDGALVVLLDVPGAPKETLELTVVERTLTVAARRAGGRGYRFTLELPDSVDADRAAARLADGVLEITLPPVARPEPRRIPVG